jgi:ABC-type Na+ efflux pump permease subunit
LVWGGYVTAAVLASALAILHSQDSSFPWREFIAIVNVCQVGAGLLLMSVTASTSLAEERVRGSLDVLMTTPLSTSSIVLGKWLGAFRHVPWLALLPGLVGAALALRTGRWYGAVWIFLTVLVQGATIVSLGLALATWVPRVGRATGLTVAAYVLMALGWIFVVIVLSPTRTDWAELMIMGSPLFSAGYLTSEVDAAGPGWRDWVYYVAPPLWTAAYFAAALAMYGASLLTFNRCLGRITMMGPPPGRGDVKKWTWEARVSPGMAFEEP